MSTKTTDQLPTNADGDSGGGILAFNRVIGRWQTINWNALRVSPNPAILPMWTHWQKLPEPPAPDAPALPEPPAVT